jgi:hypothetical protein
MDREAHPKADRPSKLHQADDRLKIALKTVVSYCEFYLSHEKFMYTCCAGNKTLVTTISCEKRLDSPVRPWLDSKFAQSISIQQDRT